jgi:hypothetical protein
MLALFNKREEPHNKGTLLVEIWTLYVSDGFMGAIHGDFTQIKELYVPALELVFNLEGDMNVFFSDRKRYAPVTKNSMGYGKIKSPKHEKTIILDEAQSQKIRDLAELQLLLKGVKKDAKGIVEDLFSTI